MSKLPYLITVDDDPDVLSAIERDLREHYRERYRVLSASSGSEAIGVLQRLKARREKLALMLADQRMPGMTGIEFFEKAIEIYPEARRVLLTAYADTEAAIRAINSARIHYYLQKPWDPPEQHLYPVLDDQLQDWEATYRAPFEGIEVVGYRWSPDAHRIKEFLSRNMVPFQWLDMEEDRRARELVGGKANDPASGQTPGLPLVILADGERLGESATRGTSRTGGPADSSDSGLLRPPGRRCRSGGAGGRGLRSVGGLAHSPGGARSARWPGRPERTDRKLISAFPLA